MYFHSLDIRQLIEFSIYFHSIKANWLDFHYLKLYIQRIFRVVFGFNYSTIWNGRYSIWRHRLAVPILFEMMSLRKISKYVFRLISHAKIAHYDCYVKPTNGRTDIDFGRVLILISKVVRIMFSCYKFTIYRF